jgi:hypothetical protein
VSVDVSKVKLASPSIVPSQVHTHIWLFTGVHTLDTSQSQVPLLSNWSCIELVTQSKYWNSVLLTVPSHISSAQMTTTPVFQLTLSTFPLQPTTKSQLHNTEDQFIVFMFVPLTKASCFAASSAFVSAGKLSSFSQSTSLPFVIVLSVIRYYY